MLYKNFGITSARPTLPNDYVGEYFDTTLNRPLWWNGNAWIDVEPKDATATIRGLVKQAESVPDGSNIDILLQALRDAGIIAT